MKKLDTYIAKQIVTGFLLVALSLMSMLWLTQSLRFVEMVTDKGLPVYLFVEMTSLLMPRVFTILSPIALFVAVMFVYNRLITDSELVVMKAVGISSVVIARAALLVGAVLALFNVFVLNVGIPAAEGKFRDLEYEVKNSFSKMMLREGAFTSFKNNMTIFIDKFLDDGTVKGILVSDGKNPAEKVVTVAESGMLEYTDIGPKILLKNGTRQVMNKKSGQFSSMTFDDYVVDFGDVSVARKKDKSVRERSISELFAEAEKPEVSEKDARAFKAEAHRRLLAPWFNLVFALLACTGLLISNFNRRGQGKVITVSILAMILVQALDMTFANMARRYEWIVALMYVNCFLPLLIAGWLLWILSTFRRKRAKETEFVALSLGCGGGFDHAGFSAAGSKRTRGRRYCAQGYGSYSESRVQSRQYDGYYAVFERKQKRRRAGNIFFSRRDGDGRSQCRDYGSRQCYRYPRKYGTGLRPAVV